MPDIYDRMRATAQRLLAPTSEGGLGQGSIRLVRYAPGAPPTNPWDPPTAPTRNVTPLNGAARGVSKEFIGAPVENGGQIVASDLQIIVAPWGGNYQLGDVLEVDAMALTILKAESIPAAGTVCAVRFFGRQAAGAIVRQGSGDITAQSAVTGTLSAHVLLSGTTSGVSGLSGAMDAAALLSGTVSGATTIVGALAARASLSSAALALSTVSAALSARAPFAGAIAAQSTVAGTAEAWLAESAALFARMTTQPNNARKTLIDNLIGALKTAGVWTKLDCLYVTAAHDAQASRLNWVQNAYNLSAVSSPTFTTDRGYTGDGSSSYLDSGFVATTAPGAKFAQNDATLGVWIGTDVTAATQNDLGTVRSTIRSRVTATMSVLANRTGADSFSIPTSTSIGLSAWSRTGATAVEAFKNGASIGTNANASSGLLATPHYICASSTTGPVASALSTRRVQAAFWGNQQTSADHLSVYNAINAYMTAIGA